MFWTPDVDLNWPDLRRDCDSIGSPHWGHVMSPSELTWLTKGLRHPARLNVRAFHQILSELTWLTKGLRRLALCLIVKELFRNLNWPDLRRDCDMVTGRLNGHVTIQKSELTWLTKGLRLINTFFKFVLFIYLSELTWLTKGLRPCGRLAIVIFLQSYLNWPDLRRDCDTAHPVYFSMLKTHLNWPDLRRDCDVDLVSVFRLIAGHLNWPDLRRDCDSPS